MFKQDIGNMSPVDGYVEKVIVSPHAISYKWYGWITMEKSKW